MIKNEPLLKAARTWEIQEADETISLMKGGEEWFPRIWWRISPSLFGPVAKNSAISNIPDSPVAGTWGEIDGEKYPDMVGREVEEAIAIVRQRIFG